MCHAVRLIAGPLFACHSIRLFLNYVPRHHPDIRPVVACLKA